MDPRLYNQCNNSCDRQVDGENLFPNESLFNLTLHGWRWKFSRRMEERSGDGRGRGQQKTRVNIYYGRMTMQSTQNIICDGGGGGGGVYEESSVL